MLTEEQPTITITAGQLKMSIIGAGASMMLTGVAGLIAYVVVQGGFDNLHAVITTVLIALVFAGLSVLLYGAIAAHLAVMRHQANLRQEIEEAADTRQRHTDRQLDVIRELVELQSRILSEFFDHLEELGTELAQQHRDELGQRRERHQG